LDAVANDHRYDAIVVGAGLSGLYLLHRLRALGLRTLVVEAGGGVGGTWYWNRYPGARCDIESLTYSYSWSPELEQEWHWTERYAPQPEILAYVEHVAERFDLLRDVRLDTRVEARFFVMATGCLSVPRVPDLPGLERYRGPAHHTGLWPHEGVDVVGRRVGVLGTGSSAVQAVTALAGVAAELTVLQRTPAFTVPAWNGPLDLAVERDHKARYPAIRAFSRTTGGGDRWPSSEVSAFDVSDEEREREFEERYAVGGFILQSAYRDLFTDAAANEMVSDFVRDRMRDRVHDPDLADRLTPRDYPLATKRMCVDTGYLEAFNRDDVRLVSLRETPLETFTETGVRVGGEEIVLDVLVLATGFDAMTGAILGVDIRGRDGLALRDAWSEGPRTYLGLTVAGFPNLFLITGPQSPSVLSNMMVSIEQHVDLIADTVAYLQAHGMTTIEPTAEAEAAWVAHANEEGDRSLYPRANSWYMGSNVPGKPRVLLPYVGGVGRYRELCERVVANGFEGFELRQPAART
jgi:cyclohexanone monooxygenase